MKFLMILAVGILLSGCLPKPQYAQENWVRPEGIAQQQFEHDLKTCQMKGWAEGEATDRGERHNLFPHLGLKTQLIIQHCMMEKGYRQVQVQ